MMRLIFFAKGQFKGDIGKKSNQFDIGKQHGHGQIKRATSCEMALSKRLVLGESEFELQTVDFNVFKQLVVYVCGTIDGTDGKTTPS
ncbi:hypothetical protein [Aeromonas veronii]|uniref:hypothetical protein n=1 Tax=Aeromonas veronii TaxID=654 RepID=UPI002A6A2BC6|nr:hypothetical protein [Aeromonas veronii]